ncbi:MAG: DUF3465 domain-containing protein [Methylophilaceae bacterium]
MFKLLLVIVIAVIYTAFNYKSLGLTDTKEQVTQTYEVAQNMRSGVAAVQDIQTAFESHISNLQVNAKAQVVKVLPDDNEAPRHQRFILKLDNGITLLVAHNINLAPRVENLNVGDTVEFNGEYEWNAKGGVVHWTHRDPQGRHADGWLRHNGKIYQ